MSKRIIFFSIITFVTFIIGYFSNSYILNINNLSIDFSLLSMYAFNSIACLIVYILIEITSTYLPNETGYAYLALSIIKIGIFILVFQNIIFSEIELTKVQKSSIIIPFLLFLVLETIGVSKLLNNINNK